MIVEAEFRAPALDRLNLLVDIAAAKVELRAILDTFDYRNLDAEPQFAGQNTTTEYLCAHIHRLLSAALAAGRLGDGGRSVTGLKVLLKESHIAWAAYEGAPAA
jgi:6-pyruvoyl-tetrahydropterin synthase